MKARGTRFAKATSLGSYGVKADFVGTGIVVAHNIAGTVAAVVDVVADVADVPVDVDGKDSRDHC